MRTRPKAPCPDCGREVSCSYVDPLNGPILWRRHRCAGGQLAAPSRPIHATEEDPS